MLGTTLKNARKRVKYATASMLLALTPSLFAQGSKPGLAQGNYTIEKMTVELDCTNEKEINVIKGIPDGYRSINIDQSCTVEITEPTTTNAKNKLPMPLDVLIRDEKTGEKIYNPNPITGRSPYAHDSKFSVSNLGLKSNNDYVISLVAEKGPKTEDIVASTSFIAHITGTSTSNNNYQNNNTNNEQRNKTILPRNRNPENTNTNDNNNTEDNSNNNSNSRNRKRQPNRDNDAKQSTETNVNSNVEKYSTFNAKAGMIFGNNTYEVIGDPLRQIKRGIHGEISWQTERINSRGSIGSKIYAVSNPDTGRRYTDQQETTTQGFGSFKIKGPITVSAGASSRTNSYVGSAGQTSSSQFSYGPGVRFNLKNNSLVEADVHRVTVNEDNSNGYNSREQLVGFGLTASANIHAGKITLDGILSKANVKIAGNSRSSTTFKGNITYNLTDNLGVFVGGSHQSYSGSNVSNSTQVTKSSNDKVLFAGVSFGK